MPAKRTPRMEALRDRIRAMVASGPMRATEGYAVLFAEGYTRNEIDRARREAASIRGITKAAQWWQPIPPRPTKPAASLVVKKSTLVRKLRALRPRPEPPPAPPPPPARYCAECGFPIGVRPPGEPPLCLRHMEKAS